MLNLMRKFVLAALLTLCASMVALAAQPATEKKGDWDDDSLDDLVAIARTFRKKQTSDGSLDLRHAKAFHSMLKQAGTSKAPLPVVMDFLDELWATKGKAVDTPKYQNLTPQSRDLVKASMVYLARLGKDGDKAVPAVLRVLTAKKRVPGTYSYHVPAGFVAGRTNYSPSGSYYVPGYWQDAHWKTTSTTYDTGDMRAFAAVALGQIGSPKAQDALAAALKGDADANVRRATTTALRQVGGIKAAPALLKALADDKDDTVRLEAAYNLGVLGAKELKTLDDRKKLYKKLKAEADSQDNAKVVAAIKKAMTAIRDGEE